MKIAYCSDLHLEFGDRDFELPDADILVLAGDILVFDDLKPVFSFTKNHKIARKFLLDVANKYLDVIFIPGNHEYYGGNIHSSSEIINSFLKSEGITNIHFSETGYLLVNGISFISATLWTDLKNDDPVVLLGNNLRDYTYISCNDENVHSGERFITPTDTTKMHRIHKEFIRNCLDRSLGDVVVVSHHAPDLMSSEQKISSILDYYYSCTDMTDLILDNPKIKFWIHGHLHTKKCYMIGDTLVTSNCRGYVGHENTDVFVVKVLQF